MDLWIRSQDKEILILASHLDIYQIDENVCVIEESGVDLGNYNSKERTLEVLDEIQNAILGIIANEDVEKQGAKKYTGNAFLSKYSNNIVYEMPEE